MVVGVCTRGIHIVLFEGLKCAVPGHLPKISTDNKAKRLWQWLFTIALLLSVLPHWMQWGMRGV